MNKLSGLRDILSETFDWNKARLDCFTKMIMALITMQAVNLSEMAVGFSSPKAKVESRYKRLYRFFRHFELDFAVLAKWIFGYIYQY